MGSEVAVGSCLVATGVKQTCLFPIQPCGRRQAPARGCMYQPHFPVHPLPTLPVLCAISSVPQQRLHNIIHRSGENGSQCRLGYHKAPPFPLQPRKEPQCLWDRLGAQPASLSRWVTQQKFTCTLLAQHLEKKTESKHSGFWGTSLRMSKIPSMSLARESKHFLSLTEKPTQLFWAALCAGGNGEVCKAQQEGPR